MRYPLAFGLMTAMIASGLLIGYAVDHQKQSHTKWQRQKREAEIASFRFEGPAVPGPVPTLPQIRDSASLVSNDCGIESHHGQPESATPRNIFQQVGWQRRSKIDGKDSLTVISNDVAQREIISPNRFASPDTSVRLSGAEYAATLWSCGNQPNVEADFLADIQRAAVSSTESVLHTKTVKSVEASNVHQLKTEDHSIADSARMATAKSKWSTAVAAFSPSLGTRTPLPVDAKQSSALDALSIARAEFKPIKPIKPIREFSYTDFVAQRSKAISNDLMDAIKLIRNSIPSQDFDSGCGSASVAAEFAAQASSDRLEFEILSSVCEINRIKPGAIQFAPFGTVETVVPNFKPWISAGLNSLKSQSESVAYVAESLTSDAGRAYHLANSRIHQNATEITEKTLSRVEKWYKSRDEAGANGILQPVPAANNLGIRAIAAKVYNWFGNGNDRLVHRTANISRTLHQWGMQQNRAVERMVLQHKGTTQR